MAENTVNRRTEATLPIPLVSVVTPSLNQGRFIRETIKSVLDQDYPAIEYLVVDGGSTDETVAVLESYSDRLAFVSEKDSGHANAVNKGFQRARGEILAFLNSDDVYLPGAVSAAVDALKSNLQAPFVYGEGCYIDQSGQVLDSYPTERFSLERLQQTCFICQPAVFIRRDALEKVGYLNEALVYCFDYEFWIRLSSLGEPVYLNQCLAHYRLHESSKTVSKRRPAHWEVARMLKRTTGRVHAQWIFALAHVIVENSFELDRSRRLQRALHVLAASLLSAGLLISFNRRIRRDEVRQILGWVGSIWRGAGREVAKRARKLRGTRATAAGEGTAARPTLGDRT